MTTRSIPAILAVAAFSILCASGCDSAGTPQRASAEQTPRVARKSISPAETAVELNRLRWKRDDAALAMYLNSEGRAATFRFLNSIDQVLDAHDQLQEAAQRKYGDRIHRAWNISAMQNNLGIFSRDIHVISQSLKGDRAVVTLQAADNLPLVRSEFNRVDGVWQLTSPFTDTSICAPLDQFAMKIDDVAERVRSGLTPIEYFDAITTELLPELVQFAAGASDDNTRVTDATDWAP